MNDKIKNIVKDKNKLLMIVPIVLAILFAFVFFSSGKKENTPKKENSNALLEPTSTEDKKPSNKLDAYKEEKKEKLKKEKIAKDSEVKGSDFYFELQEHQEQYDRQTRQRIEKLSHNPYETVMEEYNDDYNGGSGNRFSRRMQDQLDNIEDEEEFNQMVKQAQKNARIQHEISRETEERNRMMEKLSSATSSTQRQEIAQTEVIQEEDTIEKVSVTPAIYRDDTGKRRRHTQQSVPNKSNLFKARIHGDQTIVSGTPVRMRLLETAQVGAMRIPKNTIFYGTASIGASRLNIVVNNLKYGKNISPVTFIIYDNDASEGLNLPNNMKSIAAKRMQQGLLQGVQMPISSIGTVTSEVTSALTATTQVAKQILNMSLAQVKVHLKANYEMYIQEETKEDKSKRKAEEAELKALYEQISSQQNNPEKVEPLRSLIDDLE